MHNIARLTFSAGAFALVGCMSPGSSVTGYDGIPERAAPLREDDLRRLLFDASVSLVGMNERVESHPPMEIFRANGAYERVVGRVTLEGSYTFRHNSVCVRGATFARLCRQVIPQRDGTYAFVDRANGSVSLMTITRHFQGQR
jgi:hypothetical protein